MLLGFRAESPAVPWLGGNIAQWLPLALGGIIVLLAVLALTRAARPGRIALFAWRLAALGLFKAIAQSRITWIDDVTAPSGSGVALLWLGILGGAAARSVGMKDKLARRSSGWRHTAARR